MGCGTATTQGIANTARDDSIGCEKASSSPTARAGQAPASKLPDLALIATAPSLVVALRQVRQAASRTENGESAAHRLPRQRPALCLAIAARCHAAQWRQGAADKLAFRPVHRWSTFEPEYKELPARQPLSQNHNFHSKIFNNNSYKNIRFFYDVCHLSKSSQILHKLALDPVN